MHKAATNTGIPWKVFQQMEDLDFADDICLLSNTSSKMQTKLNKIAEVSSKVGLKINTKKTKFITVNGNGNPEIQINNQSIEKVDKFCYLGSVINEKGGTDEDIKMRIGKAQYTFNKLSKVWNSNNISRKTKIIIFNSNIKSVLLYGAESWRDNKTQTKKLQTFINKCLRKILKVFWPNRITNLELWEKTNQIPVTQEIKNRKWKWIGHTLRKDDTDITKEALEWNPQGTRKKGRPPNTWRRTVLKEAKELGKTWSEIKIEAKNRVRWRNLVAALCSTRERRG